MLSDSLAVPPVSAGTQQLMALVRVHHPEAVVLVRWLIESWEDIEAFGMREQDVRNVSSYYTTGMNSPSAAWATSAAANFSNAIHGLDNAFPGMIAGVQLEGLETGEWFLPPAGPGHDNHDDVPGLFVGDYSAEIGREFCAAESNGAGGECTVPPTAAERDTATLGNALLQWGHRAAPSARATRFNQFLSRRVASAISTMAAAVKRETGNAALCLAFYCYIFALSDSRLAGSGHLACAELEADSPGLDALVSPYQYATYARMPGGRLTVHGPIDSAPLHQKFWAVEDDTRTVLAAPSALRFATTLSSTINILRRNAYTAMLHKAGIYWLDLECQGWFGRPDNATTVAATSAIWTMAVHVRQQWAQLLQSTQLQAELLPAEIAIFVDEQSAAAAPLLGLDGAVSSGYMFETALIRDPWHAVAGVGAAVRTFLLSDLHLPHFPARQFKLCIFLNAVAVSPSTRAVIHEKLQGGVGKSLVWVYAPGLFASDVNQSSFQPNITAAAELTRLPLRLGTGNNSLISTFVPRLPPKATLRIPTSLLGTAYGGNIPGPVAPWLFADESGPRTAVLARYAGGHASVVRAELGGGDSSTFIGCPNPPSALWRALARAAGVHLFVATSDSDDDPYQRGDAVESGGAGLLFLAGPKSTPAQRTVLLPANFSVSDEFGNQICTAAAPCSSFRTPPLSSNESVLFWVGSNAIPLKTDDAGGSESIFEHRMWRASHDSESQFKKSHTVRDGIEDHEYWQLALAAEEVAAREVGRVSGGKCAYCAEGDVSAVRRAREDLAKMIEGTHLEVIKSDDDVADRVQHAVRPRYRVPNLARSVLLSDAVTSHGARCLDGTPARLWIQESQSTNSANRSKWYIHLMGGGDCDTLDDCADRAYAPAKCMRGSSSEACFNSEQIGLCAGQPLNETMDFRDIPCINGARWGGGLLTNDPATNPVAWDWNKVEIAYCDGNSFAGDNTTVTHVAYGPERKALPLYFRGKRILRAAVDFLKRAHGLGGPRTQLLLGGDSAGGVATFWHADFLRQALPPTAAVLAVPDSGFFISYIGCAACLPKTAPSGASPTAPDTVSIEWYTQQINGSFDQVLAPNHRHYAALWW